MHYALQAFEKQDCGIIRDCSAGLFYATLSITIAADEARKNIFIRTVKK